MLQCHYNIVSTQCLNHHNMLQYHCNIISTQCLNHHNVLQFHHNIVSKQCLNHHNVLQFHHNIISTQCLNHCNVLQCHYNIVSTIVWHQISYKKKRMSHVHQCFVTLVQMLLFIEFLSLHHVQEQQQKTQKRLKLGLTLG